jgi:L-threonylcarbamoyladenylate synthase
MNKVAKLIDIDNNLKFAVGEAKKIFFSGGVFIYPTDTIYGFGCNPFNYSAIKSLNNIKRREKGKPYILLVDSIETLLNYTDLQNDRTITFLKMIWPGPISIILNLSYKTRKLLNYNSAAFRIPDSDFCLNFLKEIKAPLVSTSVNISDGLPLDDSVQINNVFKKKVDAIFYDHQAGNYEASTLVDFTSEEPVVIRKGKINFVELWQKFS